MFYHFSLIGDCLTEVDLTLEHLWPSWT